MNKDIGSADKPIMEVEGNKKDRKKHKEIHRDTMKRHLHVCIISLLLTCF